MHDVYETRVRMAETDVAGHVYHGVYVTWMDEAVSALFREIGYDAATLERAGWSYRVARVELDFHAGAGFEDRVVNAVRCTSLGRSSMQFDYRARPAGTGADDAVLAEGSVVRVIVDDDGPTRVPEALRTALREYQTEPPAGG